MSVIEFDDFLDNSFIYFIIVLVIVFDFLGIFCEKDLLPEKFKGANIFESLLRIYIFSVLLTLTKTWCIVVMGLICFAYSYIFISDIFETYYSLLTKLLICFVGIPLLIAVIFPLGVLSRPLKE